MYPDAATTIEAVYHSDWSRIIAVLIGSFGDFDIAEEAAQEAFTTAVDQWRVSGIPEFPRAWIIQTARHKIIDRLRRKERFEEKLELYATDQLLRTVEDPKDDIGEIPDDRLRLIFTCCHPALALEAQVALTLRTLCGLQTDEIARAFLVPEATMAQRLVRAKRKIREAGIPYEVPEVSEMQERLHAVLTAVYLVFNEGYTATQSSSLIRIDLCAEAIRLGRLLRTLIGPQPPTEVTGLLALMLLQDARRDARLDEEGNIVVLEEQDRRRWNQQQIAEALPLVTEAFNSAPGPLTLQAAIAALHCQAVRPEDTDWSQIVRLYDLLQDQQPSPVVSLNRAVAIAMREGPASALVIVNSLAATGELDGYHLLHAVRADLLRRMGNFTEAGESYKQALTLVTNNSERRFLQRRLREVQSQQVS